MKNQTYPFDVSKSLDHVRHYLPTQAALKDFVHHNTLHAFQHEKFHDALWKSSHFFGYTTYLALDEFRGHYQNGIIDADVLKRIILNQPNFGDHSFAEWHYLLVEKLFTEQITSRIGQLRYCWKSEYGLNMDKSVHPRLFRLLSAFLDQGIATWQFPDGQLEFLDACRSLERNGLISIFQTPNAARLLMSPDTTLEYLLNRLVGDDSLFEQYLFDQQMAHPGWSGFVSVVESQPETLLSPKKISLSSVVMLDLLLEIDALDHKFEQNWAPLQHKISNPITPIFDPVQDSDLKSVLRIWQEAFEWSYFDQVLQGIKKSKLITSERSLDFQALFCIDDREYSFRRHVENVNHACETYGTPGYFGVAFYFQPEHGKFYTKACPAPMTPSFLIREKKRKMVFHSDVHYAKHAHGLIRGWLISNTLGFWSALKLFINIFKPSISPATAYSFMHMDKQAQLEIDSRGEIENELKVGFTVQEMAEQVEAVFKSIGLTRQFAPIVYIVGHGGSSVNNPYYAGYDCGACCGRPGAVNARVFAYMANKIEVRNLIEKQGISIPETTVFIGAMHDTTRDEIEYYDETELNAITQLQHVKNQSVFMKALQLNAQERALRFETMAKGLSPEKLHKTVKKRSISLFEPRPEWNHTDNALCIIGRSSLYTDLYLDKRPFINSYDYNQDPKGKFLLTILSAAVPVCGGINLEYYFSRVDQQKLGAGTKLPHNVVGLFGLANGIDGDLLTGLPSQMIEIHDPVRILFIVEQRPQVVLRVIQENPAIYEWIENEWVLLSVKDPDSDEIFCFKSGEFHTYESIGKPLIHMDLDRKRFSRLYKNEPVHLQSAVR